MKKFCFGIDVGGTTIKMGFFNTEGKLLDKWEIPSRVENEGKQILPDIAASILQKQSEKSFILEDIAGIGIGVPGPISRDGVVSHTANMGWGRKEVTRELSELTGLKCVGGNDANVAALGEAWKGAAKGSSDILLITLGTGIGGGIIIDGKIMTGYNGAGGEIGHVHVEDAISQPCGCGNCGCLEQVASATGIVRLAHEELEKSHEDSLLRAGNITAKDVFDGVKKGDHLSTNVAERFGCYLGKALSVAAGILNPEMIVIGGGVSKAGPILLDYVEKYYKQYVYKANREVKFVLAQLGNDAGIYGSAKLILDTLA